MYIDTLKREFKCCGKTIKIPPYDAVILYGSESGLWWWKNPKFQG